MRQKKEKEKVKDIQARKKVCEQTKGRYSKEKERRDERGEKKYERKR